MRRNLLLLCLGTIVVQCVNAEDDAGSLLQLKVKNTAGMNMRDEETQHLSDAEMQEMRSDQAWADSIENDPETQWLDDADDFYEQSILQESEKLEMLEVSGAREENPKSVFFNQVDESLFAVVDGTMGLVKHHAASNTTMIMPSRAMFNLSIDEHIKLDRQSFDAVVGRISDHSTVYLQKGEFSLGMNKGRDTAHIDIWDKWHVKIIGAVDSLKRPATNVNLYYFDTASRTMKKNYVFRVYKGGDVTIKNIRIRHAADHLHHFVAAVTDIRGRDMDLSVESGFSPANNFFPEHFMQLMDWRFDSPANKINFKSDGMQQLGYKVGGWELFNEDDRVGVTSLGGNRFRCRFPSSLPSNLKGHKMLVMHQKRTWIGVKADMVTNLVVSHLKFGSFGGAALNFKRVKNPVLYGLKCQPIHNEGSVRKKAWATCNDLGWIRNAWGSACRARKTTCMQQTDDCLNFHVFTPRVDQAESWFWRDWVNYRDKVQLYTKWGEPDGGPRTYYTKSGLPGDRYVLDLHYSPSGYSPLQDKWKAGLQIIEYRALNTRSRMMIKVNNVLVRNVVIKHNFMTGIAAEAEMCTKWNEGIPCSEVLMEDVRINDVNTANRAHWLGAIMIGTKCNGHTVRNGHRNIKVVRYTFEPCTNYPPHCNRRVTAHLSEGVQGMNWR